MLSLIICSRTSRISEELEKNIATTIGCEYELIVIDNSKNKYNIFQAYNEGIKLAKGDVLCFMHEDILYHTYEWGKFVKSHFKNKSLGMLGVLGTHYMPACPAGWWSTQCQAGRIIQGKYSDIGYYTEDLVYDTYDKEKNENELSAVAVVDGLWFCIRRSLFEKVAFDVNSYIGFHCYDIDMCMQVQMQNYMVAVCYDINIEHASLGSFNKSWIVSLNIWYKKWKNKLPCEVGGDYRLEENRKQEILARNCKYFSQYSRANAKYILALTYYFKSIKYFPYKFTRRKEYIADYLFPRLYSIIKSKIR